MPEDYPYYEQVDSGGAAARELERINQKLDWLTDAIGHLDRRREELEEMVADLIPAANGALGVAVHHLGELERNGSLDVARGAIAALETASRRIDPGDLEAVADQADVALRTLRAITAPEVTEVVERAVDTLHSSRTGKPPKLLGLLLRMRKPQVRRGLGAALELLSVLGAGARPMASAGRSPGRSPERSGAATPPARPVAARTNGHGGPAAAGRDGGGGSEAAPSPGAGAPPAGAATHQLAGQPVTLDADGFLVDPAAWTPEIAEALAAENGIGPLSDAHWRVLEFCREDAEARGAPPGLRRITQELEIPPKEMYTLFPKGPGLLASKLAGLGKPRSCV